MILPCSVESPDSLESPPLVVLGIRTATISDHPEALYPAILRRWAVVLSCDWQRHLRYRRGSLRLVLGKHDCSCRAHDIKTWRGCGRRRAVEADLLPSLRFASSPRPFALPRPPIHCLHSSSTAMALRQDPEKQVTLDFNPGGDKQTSSHFDGTYPVDQPYDSKYPIDQPYDNKYPVEQPSGYDTKYPVNHHEDTGPGGYDPIIAQYTDAQINRIIRRVDIRLIPLCGLMYCVSLLDRTNLSNAAIAG